MFSLNKVVKSACRFCDRHMEAEPSEASLKSGRHNLIVVYQQHRLHGPSFLCEVLQVKARDKSATIVASKGYTQL
ncbi:hypothetical protein GRAN_5211 [Granulicella sibirica]|uniref:Uncharacterized protein n=1 Tax=Granulicella sibirica TaxID=2479048 RepID=A0A4Q0SSI6_9BACT|nr:hypothetical protein GRAN_5211 [Granulicella sibirica]